MLMLKEHIDAYEISIGYLRSILKNKILHEVIVENPKLRTEYEVQFKRKHQVYDLYYRDYEEPEVVTTAKAAEQPPPIAAATSPNRMLKSAENLYRDNQVKSQGDSTYCDSSAMKTPTTGQRDRVVPGRVYQTFADMALTGVYEICEADGVKAQLGNEKIYSKTVNFQDGRVILYRNDSTDMVLEINLAIEMSGYQVLEQESQKSVAFKLGPGSQKSVRIKVIEPDPKMRSYLDIKDSHTIVGL